MSTALQSPAALTPQFTVRRRTASAARSLIRTAAAASLLFAAVAALYLLKSAIGIDILPGPSPLHGLLYPLLGRG